MLLVWIVATLVFLAIRFVPGDPAELLLSQGGMSPDPAAVQELREQLGLDRPLLAQYATDMRHALQGNLGQSVQDGSPVAATIGRRLPRTLELIGAAGVLAVLLGVPAGTLAAVRPGGGSTGWGRRWRGWRRRCRCSCWERCWCCCSRSGCIG